MISLRLRVAGACFKEKAHVQKGMVAGTDLKIGVPLLVKASGRPFPEPILNHNEMMSENKNESSELIEYYYEAITKNC